MNLLLHELHKIKLLQYYICVILLLRYVTRLFCPRS